ncbi:MAG: TM2 domain-containing protein [Alphaproteobacteria bacterium]|nr:TM2 domain-containing protein [Alphaproteobacteria bacterium]
MENSKKYPGKKSQLIYVVLALFFGAFGLHNFYANRWGRGLIQLLLTVGTGFVGVLVSSLWSIINIFTIETDGDGHAFELNTPVKYICGILGIFKYMGEIVLWGFLLISFLTGSTVTMDWHNIGGKQIIQEVSEKIVTPSETIYKTTQTTTTN